MSIALRISALGEISTDHVFPRNGHVTVKDRSADPGGRRVLTP